MSRFFTSHKGLLAAFCVSFLIPLTSAHAQVKSAYDTARFTAGASGNVVDAEFNLDLAPSWHTYWRNPGDAGEAPSFKIEISDKAGQIVQTIDQPVFWPNPKRFSEGGLTTYGYDHSVTFAFKSAPLKNPTDITGLKVHAEMHWLVCSTVCIPRKAEFTIDPLIAAELKLPTSPDAKILDTNLTIGENALTLKIGNLNDADNPYFYPERSGVIDANAPQIWNQAQHTLKITRDRFDADNSLNEVSGVLQNRNDYYAINADVKNVPKDLPKDGATGDGGVFAVLKLLAFAFIGGLILNLMPCVFPVLTMKAFSLVKAGHSENAAARVKSAMAYTTGVVGSFLALGGLVLILRLGSQGIGWGFQFQSPIFVLGLSWFLLALALNLLNVFQINVAAPNGSVPKTGLKGDLLTGLLAVVVASPCTAPFMGTALAGALNTSMLSGLVIFAFMGLGLAAPYVALALMPKLGRFLPKPGAWMDVFKHLLAFPILATCVWLVWIGVQQQGGIFTLFALGGALLIALALWIFGLAQRTLMISESKAPHFWRAFAVLLIVGTVASAVVAIRETPVASSPSGEMRKYDPVALAQLREEGHGVLVDMSAAWCITCLVNEKTTLSAESVQNYFKTHDIILMRGDWTNKDETISRFLKEYRHEGVPLYVWFAPHADQGEVLPQILTPQELMKDLK